MGKVKRYVYLVRGGGNEVGGGWNYRITGHAKEKCVIVQYVKASCYALLLLGDTKGAPGGGGGGGDYT